MDTKALLVTEATKLFYANGYKSVGLSKIINVTNTSKGSFYHHFPKGKEQLLIACLEKVQQDIVNEIQYHFIKHPTFKDAIL
ncbi:TetR/AcrR family transcriptional regulator [Lysinibacillus endophyticus]|uniref:TetR/AcrR family transcriptional regulator n=1 Tax=Ureibacillus endophyticus TaxID=1978490 RepID=UPI003136DE83